VDPILKKPTTSYGPSNLTTLKEDMSTKDTLSTEPEVVTGVTEKN
jgi:hypothetical protein